jgi:recombinational DNA repair protein RecT
MAKNQNNNQEQENNQTEKEFFAMVGTGRKGVEDMLVNMADEFKQIGAANVRGEYNVWAQRALVYVSTNDDLASVIKTRQGIYSVYKELAKAAQMGLQIGGHFPHGHLVPKGGKAVLMPTWEGYAFSATYGPGAVLKHEPKLIKVYENDSVFKVDEATGTYVHEYEPFGDRGKIVGYAMRLEYNDGRIIVTHITRSEVEKIAANYGNIGSPAYKKSPEAMYDKTAGKQLLKHAAKEAEGLAMMYQADDFSEQPDRCGEQPVDISSRASSRLDTIINRTPQPGQYPEEEPEKKPETESEEEGKEEPCEELEPEEDEDTDPEVPDPGDLF